MEVIIVLGEDGALPELSVLDEEFEGVFGYEFDFVADANRSKNIIISSII